MTTAPPTDGTSTDDPATTAGAHVLRAGGVSLVLDASTAVDVLVSTRRRPAALQAMTGHELFAPQIIDLEVLSLQTQTHVHVPLPPAAEVTAGRQARGPECFSKSPQKEGSPSPRRRNM